MISTSPVRLILRSFAAKQLAPDAVIRAMVEHDGWFAPITTLHAIGLTKVKDPVLPADGKIKTLPAVLHLFSDHEVAVGALNAGAPLALATGARGIDLFGRLDPAIREIRINAGSPVEDTLTMPASLLSQLPLWAAAIQLERSLAAISDSFLEEIVAYPAFFTVVDQAGGIVTLVDDAGGKQAVLFTAIDTVRTFLAEMTPAERGLTRMEQVSGRAFFAQFDRLGIAGVVINSAGPPEPRELPRYLCETLRDFACNAIE